MAIETKKQARESLGKIEEVKSICQNLDEMGIKGYGLFNIIFSHDESNTKIHLMTKIIDECGESPNKYSGFLNPVGSNENIKIYGLSYFEIAEIFDQKLPDDIKDFLKSYGATEHHTIGYHFYKKALLKEMNHELKVTQTTYGKIPQQGVIKNIFPSPVEVTARMDGNIDFKVIHTGASIVIKGNKLTAESLLKAVSKPGLKAPEGFNELDYLMAHKDLFDILYPPADHYVEYGMNEGRNPSNFFSEKKYHEMYPDLKANGWLSSGFKHFVEAGCKEGRSPDGFYKENSYVSSHKDLAALKASGAEEWQCAYFHCIDHGMFEGRVDCVDLYASS